MVLRSDSVSSNCQENATESSTLVGLVGLPGLLYRVIFLNEKSLKTQLKLVLGLLLSVIFFQASMLKYRKNLKGWNNE